MAEVRKHRPRTSSIGDQVRAKVDSGPRPLTPGERYDPDFDPFFSEEPNQVPEIPETGNAAAASATTGKPGPISASGPCITSAAL